jgi:hypothetical protein
MSDFRLVNTFYYHERTLFIAEWNEAYELDFFLGAIFFLKEAFLVVFSVYSQKSCGNLKLPIAVIRSRWLGPLFGLKGLDNEGLWNFFDDIAKNAEKSSLEKYTKWAAKVASRAL